MLTTSEIVIIPSVMIFIISMVLLLATVVFIVAFGMYHSTRDVSDKELLASELVKQQKENKRLQDVLVAHPTEVEKPVIRRKHTAGPDLVSDSAASRIVKNPTPVRLVPTQREIKRVIFNKEADWVQCFDDHNHVIAEYCGPFSKVGHKILAVYNGRWIQKDCGEEKILPFNRDTPIPATQEDMPTHA